MVVRIRPDSGIVGRPRLLGMLGREAPAAAVARVPQSGSSRGRGGARSQRSILWAPRRFYPGEVLTAILVGGGVDVASAREVVTMCGNHD
jgi:hypothetical protein